ncbi:MAG: transposase [Bacteroidales bacterium]
MSKPKFELAQIIEQFAKPFVQRYKPNAYQLRILNAISICRTSALGGHASACDCCGTISVSYNSCRNRHCPKCQVSRQAIWVDDLLQATLPVKHYHIVFTVPHLLNDICLLDSAAFYNRLFACVWDTLRSFGYKYFGSETGAVCILHTWGQNLSLHPHVHCIVPAAGYTLAGNWKKTGRGGKYLYPVSLLSVDFRSHFLKSTKRWLKANGLLAKHQHVLDEAWKKPWVVFCEPSMAKPEHVVKYLGNYTHRVAISNSRILGIDDKSVTFLHKDYAEGAHQKPVTMDGVEFLRRFCLHILSRGFVKIRRFGIYSSSYRKIININRPKPDIDKLIKRTTAERVLLLTGFDVFLCPVCKQGRMHRIEEIPRARSPDSLFAILSKSA